MIDVLVQDLKREHKSRFLKSTNSSRKGKKTALSSQCGYSFYGDDNGSRKTFQC